MPSDQQTIPIKFQNPDRFAERARQQSEQKVLLQSNQQFEPYYHVREGYAVLSQKCKRK